MAEEKTLEQIAELEAKAAEVDGLKEQMKGMVPGAELDKLKGDLEQAQKDQNPNWPKTRAIIDNLRKVAKEKGVEVDDDGNVKSNPNNVNMDDLVKRAEEAGRSSARNELLGTHLQARLSGYDKESATLVKHFYERITNGETVTIDNMDKFVQMAHSAAEVESGSVIKNTSRANNFSGGQGPRQTGDVKGLDNASAKNLAGLMGIKINSEDQK